MRRRGGEEEQATDIKSNNPHLAGGEKYIELYDNTELLSCVWLVNSLEKYQNSMETEK